MPKEKPKSARRQAIEKVKEILLKSENIKEEKVLQRCPYTCVSIMFDISSFNLPVKEYNVLGFSKVRYPDVFNAVYGYELAKDKAVTHLAKQIIKMTKPKIIAFIE